MPSTVILGLVVLLAVVFSGSFGRPIWIDEVFHFALGSHHSTAEAWETIAESVLGASHGQTGIYMLVDYWLLQVFGANLVALRLPSLLSGLWLFAAGIAVMRLRGYGFGWQFLVVLALFGQDQLMYFVGEARPYLPLAAASLGILAYYLSPPGRRRESWVRILGMGSILLGVTMHPYFSIYWVALFVFGYFVLVTDGQLRFGFRSLFEHVNIVFTVIGISLYFWIAAMTWGRYIAEFDLDPFQWIDLTRPIQHFLQHSHLQFLSYASWAALVVMLAVLPVTFLGPTRWSPFLKPLVAPVALLLLAIALSLLVSYLSYVRNYWIVPRQWIAGFALSAVAVVWFSAELARMAASVHKMIPVAILLLAFLVIGAAAGPDIKSKSQSLVAYLATPSSEERPAAPATDAPLPQDNDAWVELANLNIEAGGDVWPIFRYFWPFKRHELSE